MDIKWNIPADKLWSEIQKDPQSFKQKAQAVVESTHTDSDDDKWWIFAYKHPSDNNVVISLATRWRIIKTISVTSKESAEEAVMTLLDIISNKNKIVIIVESGFVTDVYSSHENSEVTVIDLDSNDGEDDEQEERDKAARDIKDDPLYHHVYEF